MNREEKEVKRIAGNVVLFLINGLLIAGIVCLLFFQRKNHVDEIRPTIQNFEVTSDAYFSENEVYQQKNTNIHTYTAKEKPNE